MRTQRDADEILTCSARKTLQATTVVVYLLFTESYCIFYSIYDRVVDCKHVNRYYVHLLNYLLTHLLTYILIHFFSSRRCKV